MNFIQLQPIPSQLLRVTLVDQNWAIRVYQKFFGMFFDFYQIPRGSATPNLLLGGIICQNMNRLVRSAYLGFTGDLCFYDSQGVRNPYYTGLNNTPIVSIPGLTGTGLTSAPSVPGRYSLLYLTPDEVNQLLSLGLLA